MTKFRKRIIAICLILVCLIAFHNQHKNSLYGNTSKEILRSLSKIYDSSIKIIDVIEIDDSKIVAFSSNENTGIATFIKINNNFKFIEAMTGQSDYLVNYGYMNPKRMCATIVDSENISTILFKRNNVIEKKWEVNIQKPTLFYYNGESIQDSNLEFEFIFLDKQGNKILT